MSDNIETKEETKIEINTAIPEVPLKESPLLGQPVNRKSYFKDSKV
jgi:hypothetical protein